MSDKVVKLGARKKDKKEKAAEDSKEKELVYCSFCGRPNTEVVKMVKGPGVNICSECTMIAVQSLILGDRLPSAQVQALLDALWNKCR